MVFYLNIALIGMVVAGLVCLVLGILSIVRSQNRDEKGHKNKEKFFRGIKITVIGVILTVIFGPLLIKALYQEITNGESFVKDMPMLLIFFFFPLVIIIAFVFMVFFAVMGATSLQEGYKHRKEGVYDKESIILGYVMLAIGTIVIVSLVMFVLATIGEFNASLKRSFSKTSSYPSSRENVFLYLLNNLNNSLLE